MDYLFYAKMKKNSGRHPRPEDDKALLTSDIVKEFKDTLNCSYLEARYVMDDLIKIIIETLEKGETIQINEFGKFVVREHPEKVVWSGICDSHVRIRAKRRVHFLSSVCLRRKMNQKKGQ